MQRWIMADALLAPQFYELPDVAEHFEKAKGSPDAKAEDVFQLMKITYWQNGRGDEVWW
ncbi:hypothetical protein [Oceanicola sp. D3]|uniref:hypothetical protein n=1 Tax=Oceanicola sp. D3 TaxID=2587163 RepID=UPI00143D3656|nr:hypothetical protein [Oceanicola sp. D3]